MKLIRRCPVPDVLEPVTSRSPAEVDPRQVGADPAGVARIWHVTERLYRTGMHPAIALCIRRHGEVVLDRAVGYARGNDPDDPPDAPRVPMSIETPACIFSASKAVTAMVIHRLDEKRLLHVDDLVVEYIPEFGRHGKDRITIEHVLTHRAGIPNLPPEDMKLEYLLEPDFIIERMCAAEPVWTPGRRLAYHAITGGFVLGEIVRRVTGKSIRQVLREEILRPLGFRWMNYGVSARDVGRVARNAFTGPPVPPPFSWFLRRVLGVGLREAVELSNDPLFLTSIIPSANVVTTANELSRFYQLLLNGGELDGIRIFEPRTIRRATSEQSYLEVDLTLGIPLRYSMGFMLGGLGLYGPDTPQAFGHVGFINIFSWADPERQVAAALITTGKPLFYPGIYFIWDLMRQISAAFPKEPPRRLRRKTRTSVARPSPRSVRPRRQGRSQGSAPLRLVRKSRGPQEANRS